MARFNPETDDYPPYREGICNAVRKDDLPCTKAVLPGTMRCQFHPVAKYPKIYAKPETDGYGNPIKVRSAPINPYPVEEEEPIDPPMKLTSEEIKQAIIHPMDYPAPAPKSTAQPGMEYCAPGMRVEDLDPVLTAKVHASQGMEEKWVLDDNGTDYVKKLVPIADYKPEPQAWHDAWELGPAYFEGEHVDFDYRFITDDPKNSLEDRKNGFVPISEALDNRFHKEGGKVRFGDLILARRPKWKTEEREREQQTLHERITGEVNQWSSQEGASGFAREEANPPRPRNAKTYSFPNNPIGRDKVAERHR